MIFLKENAWKAVTTKTVEKFGKVDILINNAGTHFDTRMSDISLEEWKKIININDRDVFRYPSCCSSNERK